MAILETPPVREKPTGHTVFVKSSTGNHQVNVVKKKVQNFKFECISQQVTWVTTLQTEISMSNI